MTGMKIHNDDNDHRSAEDGFGKYRFLDIEKAACGIIVLMHTKYSKC